MINTENTSQRGFTLLELVITIAILLLIAAIALPNYRNHVLRANRTDAMAALTRIAAAQEKFYLQNNTYSDDVGPAGLNTGLTSEHYQLAITSDDLTARFTASATPLEAQLQDRNCRLLTIDNFGTKTAKDENQNDTTDVCWR